MSRIVGEDAIDAPGGQAAGLIEAIDGPDVHPQPGRMGLIDERWADQRAMGVKRDAMQTDRGAQRSSGLLAAQEPLGKLGPGPLHPAQQ